MEIYFINIEEFLKNVEHTSLEAFMEGKSFGSQKRKTEFCLGRFLIKYVLKNKYNLSNLDILLNNKKPYVTDSPVKFSLTHSKNYVMAVFDKSETGIDLELMKERNFTKLFDYYKLTPPNKDKATFYQLWTQYEAKIKLQKEPKTMQSFVFKKDYSLSVCSDELFDISKMLKIYELKSPTHNMNPNELINLKLVIESNKNEKALVAQEINTADLELLSALPLNLKIE